MCRRNCNGSQFVDLDTPGNLLRGKCDFSRSRSAVSPSRHSKEAESHRGMHCTRCESTGFLNIHQLPSSLQEGLTPHDVPYLHSHFTIQLTGGEWRETVLKWIENNQDHDVQVCDCCGNGEVWWGEPGQHDRRSGENWPPSCI